MEDLVARIQITSGPQQALALLTSPSTTELLQSERHEALAIALSLDPRQQALAMLYLLCVAVAVGGCGVIMPAGYEGVEVPAVQSA